MNIYIYIHLSNIQVSLLTTSSEVLYPMLLNRAVIEI